MLYLLFYTLPHQNLNSKNVKNKNIISYEVLCYLLDMYFTILFKKCCFHWFIDHDLVLQAAN